jgi:hypothetical protein
MDYWDFVISLPDGRVNNEIRQAAALKLGRPFDYAQGFRCDPGFNTCGSVVRGDHKIYSHNL